VVLKRQGFFLLEIIITVAFFCSLASIIAYYQWYIVLWGQESLIYGEAVSKVNEVCELMIRDQQLPILTNRTKERYTITCQVIPLLQPNYSNDIVKFELPQKIKLVAITATWRIGRKNKSFTITTILEDA
jgi:hypothetical protein